MTTELDQAVELELCRRDHAFFVNEYCSIYDSVVKGWIPFKLWGFQEDALEDVHNYQHVACLKARQEGLTWLLGVAYPLWQCLFEPIAYCMLFSLTEDEAKVILKRLVGMYDRLPLWMREAFPISQLSTTSLEFANESKLRAYATTRGDSNIATYAIVDEADLVPDLDDMLGRINPTIEAGGKLVLLSRSDKNKPDSTFKKIYKDAEKGLNDYHAIFIPWHAHPNRDANWYEATRRTYTTLDKMHEQYPATAEEALTIGSENRMYPNFSVQTNVSESADYNPAYPVEWWVDVGWDDPTVILLVQWKPLPHNPECVCVFGEYRFTRTLEETAILSVLDKCLAHQPIPIHAPEKVVFDSANPSFGGAYVKVRTARQLLGQVVGSDKKMGIMGQVDHVRYYIGTDDVPRRFIIHPRCDILISDMIQIHKSKDGGDVKPAHDEFSHGEAAVRYGLAQTYYKINR